MQDTYHEFSLPYIDKELDNKRMRLIVDYLINQEKEQMAPIEDATSMPQPPPPQESIDLSNPVYPSKGAHYESLVQELGLLSALCDRRKEFWGGEDKKLCTYIALVEKKQRSLQEEIDQINLDRFNQQKEAQNRIIRLRKQIKNLEDNIDKERQEIERLSLT